MSVTTTSAQTFPTTPVAYVDQTGIHVPAYEDVLTYFINQYLGIYGEDTYLGDDSQDFQWIAIVALAIHDANSMAVQVYNSFSPATAEGIGLSSVVKINNMRRLVPTNSMVDLLLIGQNGTTIINGIARDENQNNWLLPPTVQIPPSGEITVTAIAANSGAISADQDTIQTILTPVRGWQSVNNPAKATQGDPLESDAALRQRQTVSTELPSQTVLDGMTGGVAEIPGVVRYISYENDTKVTDANGIPGNSVAFVVDGGDAQVICDTIMLRKPPGCGTYGTTTETVIDQQGVSYQVSFFRPVLVPITVALTIQPLVGYTTSTAQVIAQAIADFVSSLDIGGDVYLTQIFHPAYMLPDNLGVTYNIVQLLISRTGSPSNSDVVMAFNEAATCTLDNIIVTVLVH